MKRHHALFSILFVMLSLLLAGCAALGQASEVNTELTPVRLSLGYIPDIQFAPYYVGLEKGFFAEHGIDLTTEHRQETEGARLLATGEINFAVLSGEQVLLARQQELPLVYFFEWYQQFPVAVAAKAGSGISAVEDLAGRSVGTPVKEGASYIGLEALLGAAGLTDADIDLQTTGYSQVETLVTDRVDAVVVYVANEPVQLEAAGEEIVLLRVSDHADLVSNGLITSEAVIEEQPELVRAMAGAMAESIAYTTEHPDEAFEISQGYVEGLDNPDTQDTAREVLARSIALWQGETIGYTDPQSWASMQDILLEVGLLNAPLDLERAYTNEFLP